MATAVQDDKNKPVMLSIDPLFSVDVVCEDIKVLGVLVSWGEPMGVSSSSPSGSIAILKKYM